MTSVLTIVGPRDPKLEELVRASGRVTTVTWLSDLEHARRRESDAAGCAAGRRAPRSRGSAAARDAQAPASGDQRHPAGGDARSGADARRHARRRQRVHRGTSSPGGHRRGPDSPARAAHHRAPAGPVFAFVGAKGGVGTTTTAVNVATDAREALAGRRAIDRSAPGVRRCRRIPRRRRAILGARCAREPAPTGCAVPEESRLPHRLGLDLLASADRPATRLLDVRRLGSVIQLAASQYAYTVLDVPRSDLTVLDSARRRRQPGGRGEPGTRHRPQRRAHGRGAARAISEDERHDRHQPYRRPFRDQPAGRGKGRGGQRSPTRFRATTAARCWPCTKGRRSRSTITISSRRRSPRSPEIWPASADKKAERATGRIQGIPVRTPVMDS